MKRATVVLPLQLWLAMALVALVAVPVLASWALSTLTAWQQQHADQARIGVVRQVVGLDDRRWRDPGWQHRAITTLAGRGIELRLVDAAGNQVFITSGARQILNTYTGWSSPRMPLDFQKIAISTVAVPGIPPQALAAGKQVPRTNAVIGTASLWFTRAASGSPPTWLIPAGTATALLLTLAAVAGLLGWAVVRPLTALSRAVDQIAGGDLDIRLPASRAHEVVQVGSALAGLSTTLRESLERQVHLGEERRLFISAIAHDLRTPLFMLRGYLQGLETGVAHTPEQVAQYVRACASRADALERLIADLFAYARLEYRDQGLRREPVVLDELLQEAVASMQAVASTKAVSLELEGSTGGCVVIGDGTLLGRAMQNLLDNAVRHTPSYGYIRVRWYQQGAQLVVQVEDSGPGIAPLDLTHLFTPLYRGDASRNRQTGGAGLGLTIAQRTFQIHGGDLTAANALLGGAILTGTLPLHL